MFGFKPLNQQIEPIRESGAKMLERILEAGKGLGDPEELIKSFSGFETILDRV